MSHFNMAPMKTLGYSDTMSIRMAHLRSSVGLFNQQQTLYDKRKPLQTEPLRQPDTIPKGITPNFSGQKVSDFLMSEKRSMFLNKLEKKSSIRSMCPPQLTAQDRQFLAAAKSDQLSMSGFKRLNVNAPVFVPLNVTTSQQVVIKRTQFHPVIKCIKPTVPFVPLVAPPKDPEIKSPLSPKHYNYDRKTMLELYKNALNNGVLNRPDCIPKKFNDANGIFEPATWLQHVLSENVRDGVTSLNMNNVDKPMRCSPVKNFSAGNSTPRKTIESAAAMMKE